MHLPMDLPWTLDQQVDHDAPAAHHQDNPRTLRDLPALWEHQLGLYTARDHDQGLVTPFNPLRGPDGLSSPGAITPGPVK